MRTILIAALLVPAVTLAAPRKKPKKKKKAAPVATEPVEKPDDEATDADKPDPATTPLLKGDSAGTGSGSGSATPTIPTTPTTAPKAGTTPTTTPTTRGTGPSTTPASATPSTPAPPSTSEPAEKPEPEAKDVDVDSLRQEYLSLRDELFKSRARANAVASALYSTRVTIKFTWASARYYGVSKASIRLDGATVFEDASGAIAGDDGVRFDGYVAPGKHLVTFHVEATGKDDDSFTSATESQIVVKAVANKDLVINAKGHDNGDIAYSWKKSERGNYGIGIDVGVKTVATGAKK